MNHNLYAYTVRKCRCDVCKAAKAKHQKAYKLRKHAQHRLYPELTPHGTSAGYSHYGCRCDYCCSYTRAKNARWRSKR